MSANTFFPKRKIQLFKSKMYSHCKHVHWRLWKYIFHINIHNIYRNQLDLSHVVITINTSKYFYMQIKIFFSFCRYVYTYFNKMIRWNCFHYLLSCVFITIFLIYIVLQFFIYWYNNIDKKMKKKLRKKSNQVLTFFLQILNNTSEMNLVTLVVNWIEITEIWIRNVWKYTKLLTSSSSPWCIIITNHPISQIHTKY